MAATYVKFYTFVQYLCTAYYNFSSDTCKLALSNTAPTAASNTTFSTDITEISAGNGYTAGGAGVTITTDTQTSGTYTLAGDNVTWTASGGSIATFRYVVLWDSTQSTHNLIAYWDYGSGVTLNTGDTFTPEFNSTSTAGTIFTLA